MTDHSVATATMSVEDAGRLLGIGRQSAYQAVRCGEIPAVRIGGRWLVLRAPLMRKLAGDAAA